MKKEIGTGACGAIAKVSSVVATAVWERADDRRSWTDERTGSRMQQKLDAVLCCAVWSKYAPLAWASGSSPCLCCWEKQGGCGKIGLLLRPLFPPLDACLKRSKGIMALSHGCFAKEWVQALWTRQSCELQTFLLGRHWSPFTSYCATSNQSSTLMDPL